MDAIIIFVNGYWNSGDEAEALVSKLSKRLGATIQKIIARNIGAYSHEKYWHKDFVSNSEAYFSKICESKTGCAVNNTCRLFLDGKGKINSSGKTRFNAGYKHFKSSTKARQSVEQQLKSLGAIDESGNQQKHIFVVTHSMGAAYAEGLLKAFAENNLSAMRVLHFAPADNTGFKINFPDITFQINIVPDIVLMYKNYGDVNKILIKNFVNELKSLVGAEKQQSKNKWQIKGLNQQHYIEYDNGYKIFNHRYSKSSEVWEMLDWLKNC